MRRSVLPAHGQLDRRRPRRQSVRDRRGAARRRCALQSAPRDAASISTSCTRSARELSLDSRLVGVSAALASAGRHARPTARRTAATSPTGARSPASMRALAATARERSIRSRPPRHAGRRRRRAYRDAGEFLADLDDHRRLADRQRLGARSPRGRLRSLRRAVDCLRLSSRGARPAAELRRARARRRRAARARAAGHSTIAALERGRAHRACCCDELGTARPLASPFIAYSRGDRGRARDPARGRRGASPLRARGRCRTT